MTGAATQSRSTTNASLWSDFSIHPDSIYADQDAAELAAICATELTGYLASATMIEEAIRIGRNPLVIRSRDYTPKQLDALREDLKLARHMLTCMLHECACAFGSDAADRLYTYIIQERDKIFNSAPREPEQVRLF